MLIVFCLIVFSSSFNVNAIEDNYNYDYDSNSGEIIEYSDSDSVLLEPMDSSDYDVHEAAIEGGGTYYPHEILMFRIFVAVIIIIVIVVVAFLYKKMKKIKSKENVSDFYKF